MYYLGISAFYHDSAAVLLKDGKVVVAIEEERLSRIKHDNSFPKLAIQYCLNYAEISINDIECIAYYEKPLKKLERILETYVRRFPLGILSFVSLLPEQLTKKILVEKIIKKELNYQGKIYYSTHHLSHAAAAYYPSPFNEAAVVTIDGVGEVETTCLWHAKGDQLTLLKTLHFPHSLGLWYSAFTAYLGFLTNEDEYKVMGMAAYGEPKYVSQIKQTIKVKADGSFILDLSYFNFEFSKHMWSKKLERLLGKARMPDSDLTKRHYDLAASLQVVFEEVYIGIMSHIALETKAVNLCLGGGVALNAKANGLVLDRTNFENLYIFGASGDSGAALGAALLAWYQNNKEVPRTPINNLCLGKKYSDEEIKLALDSFGNKFIYKKLNAPDLVKIVSEALEAEKVVACFSGGSEFGPRALGSRSILASAKMPIMKDVLNHIKGRELFRPFGGVILKSEAQKYFLLGSDTDLPFMNICKPVLANTSKEIAALVHQDGSCRIQTVTEQSGFIYELLSYLNKVYQKPILINTSFNIKGQPIIETPNQALDMFLHSKINFLVLGDYFISKKEI